MSGRHIRCEIDMLITKIQRFSTGDGPGIRTTVFFQGCPLRCSWCHNPETQSHKAVLIWTPRDCIGCGACLNVCRTDARQTAAERNGARLVYDRTQCISCGQCAAVCSSGACEMSSREMTPEEILQIVMRDVDFYGADGGVTLSGGEPLWGADALTLLRLCREHGLNTAVETSGAVPISHMRDAAELTNLILFDIKDTNSDRLRHMTGADLQHILENLRVAASTTHGKIRLRCIMVRTVNMESSHYNSLIRLYRSLEDAGYGDCLDGLELLPYHAYAGSKACGIGLPDNGRRDWIPTEEDMRIARETLTRQGIFVL